MTKTKPRHVAIIMDGNGRWAHQRSLPRSAGHKQGVEAVRRAVRAALDLGIEYLTIYSFSSENWSRPPGEVNYLLDLLRRQVHGILYDSKKKQLQIYAEGNLLKMVTSTSIMERDAGMVLAIYVNDPDEGVLLYSEKVDYYNIDYDDVYQPDPDEMVVLMRDVQGLEIQYAEEDGTLKVTYAGLEYELFPRCWQEEEG